MAVVIGTSQDGLPAGGEAPAQGQPIRGDHLRRIASDEHMARAKLRKIWGWGDGASTTSDSYTSVANDVPIRFSKSSSEAFQVVVLGDNVDVLITEGASGAGGVISITAGAGPTSATLSSDATGGGVSSDATSYIRISIKRNAASGTGILTALLVYEVTHDSSTIT